MGDFRAIIKIKMHLINKDYKTEMSINYWDDGDGNDERVKEWFRECYEDAQSRYRRIINKRMRAEEEKAERSLYEKLKKKFE